jgi:hypothetical protein
MRLFDIRLCRLAMLALIVALTGCGKPATSTSPDRVPAAAALLGPADAGVVAAEADADPLTGLANAAGAFPPRPDPAPASAGAAESIPGTDAAIQRWFLDNGAVKVRFNDALLQAWKAVAARDAARCRPLDSGVRALAAVLPALEELSPAGQKLAAAIRAPLTTFAAAATACLARDFPAARTALDSAAAQQGDAQESVDEILEGEE